MLSISPEIATTVSAAATALYAAIAALSLLLLSRQIRDARRFGAAPALYALLKELEEHMAAIRLLREPSPDAAAARETIVRYLEFFERVEHLRGAGVLPTDVLSRAFGPVLDTHLADPRFRQVIEQSPRQHAEVLALAKHLRRH